MVCLVCFLRCLTVVVLFEDAVELVVAKLKHIRHCRWCFSHRLNMTCHFHLRDSYAKSSALVILGLVLWWGSLMLWLVSSLVLLLKVEVSVGTCLPRTPTPEVLG
jgi:hypothetical protein